MARQMWTEYAEQKLYEEEVSDLWLLQRYRSTADVAFAFAYFISLSFSVAPKGWQPRFSIDRTLLRWTVERASNAIDTLAQVPT